MPEGAILITDHYIIVTNSYHRSLALVERSLRASLCQVPAPLQVIFIDENETPLQLSPDLVANPLLFHQCVAVKSVSAARNLLKIPSSAEWIIFCDDDGFLDKDYVARWQKLRIQHPDLHIFAGSICRDDNGEFYSLRHKKGGTLKKFIHAKLLMGSNVVVKAEVFEKLGRFDDSFGAGAYWGSSEETDFAWKAYFNHVPMEFFPELIVYHVRPYAGAFVHSLKKSYRYGEGKGALVVKWLLRGHLIVLLELLEMFLVPWIQMMRGVVTANWSLIPINFFAMVGRLVGMIKYPFVH